METKIEEILKKSIEKLKEPNNKSLNCSEDLKKEFPTNIFYWEGLVELMSKLQNKTEQEIIIGLYNDDNYVTDGNRCFLETLEISIILWIEVLLRNPFKIQDVLLPDSIKCLEEFLLLYLSTINKVKIKKSILKSLSILLKQVYSDESEIFYKKGDLFFIRNIEVPDNIFYCFLKHLSQTTGISTVFTQICSDDSITVMRYKLKILPNICNTSTVIDTLQYCIGYLNFDDSKFGWTISKVIYKLSRLVNKQSIIADLVNMLSDEIFSDEQRWINVMTILSFMVLEGEDLGRSPKNIDGKALDALSTDLSFIDRGLSYSNEFYPKSSCLRETSLFLVWCLIKSNNDISQFINRIIFISLFDKELSCRRAAATIVEDYVRRVNNLNVAAPNKGFTTDPIIYLDKEDCSFKNIGTGKFAVAFKNMRLDNGTYTDKSIDTDKNLLTDKEKYPSKDMYESYRNIGTDNSVQPDTNNYKLYNNSLFSYLEPLSLILPGSIKKRALNLYIFNKFENKIKFLPFFKTSLYSPDREMRIIAAKVLSDIMDPFNFEILYKTVPEKDGTNLYFYYLIAKIKTKEKICLDNCFRNFQEYLFGLIKLFKPFIDSLEINLKNYKIRNFNFVCDSYLKIYKFFDPEMAKNNLLFLLNKGYSAEALRVCTIAGFTDNLQNKFGNIAEEDQYIYIHNENEDPINDLNNIVKEKKEAYELISIDNPIYFLSKLENPSVFNDLEFSKKIFSSIAKNPSFILINSNNYLLKDKVVSKLIDNLNRNIYTDFSIRALRYIKSFDENTEKCIKVYLEDYSISYMGDIGCFNRREAIEYFLSDLNNNIKDNKKNSFVFNHLVLYLSDKSKYLRDVILKILLDFGFTEYSDLFSLGSVVVDLEKSTFLSDYFIKEKTLNSFFLNYKNNLKKATYEASYFKALFDSFIGNDYFIRGIWQCFNASDSSVVCILKELFKEYRTELLSRARDNNFRTYLKSL